MGGGGAEDMFSGFGGGGRGGPRARSSRMGGGMPGMGGGGFGGGMPGGFGGMDSPGGGSSAPPPPGEIVRPLALTLEELYTGGTKRLKITRHMRNGGQEERVLEVVYKPGWKKVSLSPEDRVPILTHRARKSSLHRLGMKTSMDKASTSCRRAVHRMSS